MPLITDGFDAQNSYSLSIPILIRLHWLQWRQLNLQDLNSET